jgi:hypothetical protein
MSAPTIRRVARKRHQCGCGQGVEPGHVYLIHTLFPGNDVWDIDHPVRVVECAECAARYGRRSLLGEIPAGQPRGYWLGAE